MVAYWLIPAEPTRSEIVSLISALARKYDAPVFEPHVTLSVSDDDETLGASILTRIAARVQPITLEVACIDHSAELTQTLFIQFAQSAEERRLSAALRASSPGEKEDEFKPHLSLLYARIDAEARCKETHRIRLPFAQLRFDALQAVALSTPIETRGDVEAWRKIAEAQLSD